MDKLGHFILLDAPQAAGIWISLILTALAVFGLVLAPGRSRRPAPPDNHQSTADRNRLHLHTHAIELSRYADEVAVAADRATAMADKFRLRWLGTQEAAEKAWQKVNSAAAAERRLAAAATLPAPDQNPDPSEYADRRRYLHRAVMSACSRNELPVLQLSEALAHRNGWDPTRHPVEQELVVRRAILAAREADHVAAVAREQAAWAELETALNHAGALRVEASAAARRAGFVRHGLRGAVTA